MIANHNDELAWLAEMEAADNEQAELIAQQIVADEDAAAAWAEERETLDRVRMLSLGEIERLNAELAELAVEPCEAALQTEEAR